MSRHPYSPGVSSPTSPASSPFSTPSSPLSPQDPLYSPYSSAPSYSPGATSSGVSSPVHSQFLSSTQNSLISSPASYASPTTSAVQTPQAPAGAMASPGGVPQSADPYASQQLHMDDVIVAHYTCGDCGKDTELRIGKEQSDAVACKDCGERILYKKRSTIPMQYEAR